MHATGHNHALATLLPGKNRIFNKQEVGWVPDSVWTFWSRKKKSSYFCPDPNPGSSWSIYYVIYTTKVKA